VHISPTQTLYRAPTSRGFPVPYKAAAECAVREAYTLPAPAAYGPIPGLRSRRVRGALPADRPSAQARVASSLRPRFRRAPPLRSWRTDRAVRAYAGRYIGRLASEQPRERDPPRVEFRNDQFRDRARPSAQLERQRSMDDHPSDGLEQRTTRPKWLARSAGPTDGSGQVGSENRHIWP